MMQFTFVSCVLGHMPVDKPGNVIGNILCGTDSISRHASGNVNHFTRV